MTSEGGKGVCVCLLQLLSSSQPSRKTDLKCKPMGQVRMPSVNAEWSPCGRYLLTAITAPRLRVDNGLRIFS